MADLYREQAKIIFALITDKQHGETGNNQGEDVNYSVQNTYTWNTAGGGKILEDSDAADTNTDKGGEGCSTSERSARRIKSNALVDLFGPEGMKHLKEEVSQNPREDSPRTARENKPAQENKPVQININPLDNVCC